MISARNLAKRKIMIQYLFKNGSSRTNGCASLSLVLRGKLISGLRGNKMKGPRLAYTYPFSLADGVNRERGISRRKALCSNKRRIHLSLASNSKQKSSKKWSGFASDAWPHDVRSGISAVRQIGR